MLLSQMRSRNPHCRKHLWDLVFVAIIPTVTLVICVAKEMAEFVDKRCRKLDVATAERWLAQMDTKRSASNAGYIPI